MSLGFIEIHDGCSCIAIGLELYHWPFGSSNIAFASDCYASFAGLLAQIVPIPNISFYFNLRASSMLLLSCEILLLFTCLVAPVEIRQK